MFPLKKIARKELESPKPCIVNILEVYNIWPNDGPVNWWIHESLSLSEIRKVTSVFEIMYSCNT